MKELITSKVLGKQDSLQKDIFASIFTSSSYRDGYCQEHLSVAASGNFRFINKSLNKKSNKNQDCVIRKMMQIFLNKNWKNAIFEQS